MSSPGNAMVPDAAAQGTPVPGADPADPTVGLMNHMSSIHNVASAKYDKIKDAQGQASAMRQELDKLLKLGDTITQKDVVAGATKMISAGMGAAELAGLLSEMPQDGEALQGWIVQHDLQMRQMEAKLSQLAATTRHDLGVGALRLAAAHSMMNPVPAPGQQPQTIEGSAQPPDSQAPGTTTQAVNDLMPEGSNG